MKSAQFPTEEGYWWFEGTLSIQASATTRFEQTYLGIVEYDGNGDCSFMGNDVPLVSWRFRGRFYGPLSIDDAKNVPGLETLT